MPPARGLECGNMRSQYSVIVTSCTKLTVEVHVEAIWALWLILIFAAVPIAIGGGTVAMLRRGVRPLIAVPGGFVLGLIAAPTFLIGSYIFFIGWFAAAFVWAFSGAWHRYVTDVWTIEAATVVSFVLAWFLAGSFGSLIQSGESATKVLGDAWLLASPLVATVIVLEFAAASWDWMVPRTSGPHQA